MIEGKKFFITGGYGFIGSALAQKIVNKIAQNPDYRDLTFLLSLDTLPKIVPFLNNDELYVLNDPKSRKKDEDNYMLSFGVIYDG